MKPDFIYYFLRWFRGLCDIVDGIIILLSLGFYCPNISLRITFYDAKRMLKKRIKEDMK